MKKFTFILIVFTKLIFSVTQLKAQTITTVAGSSNIPGFSGDGGPATNAELNLPTSVCLDYAGNLYISDEGNNRIRKVNALTGIITTVAGTGVLGYTGDGGPAIDAEIGYVTQIAIDGAGNIYIADVTNSCIREVNAISGFISTVAGNGYPGYSGDGGPATAAEMNSPDGVAVDNHGNIYIPEQALIRKVNSAGIISTIAGTIYSSTTNYNTDGVPATSISLCEVSNISVDDSGSVYFAAYGCDYFFKISSSGLIYNVAGNGTAGYPVYGMSATNTQVNDPFSISTDIYGNMYLAMWSGARIAVINEQTGIINSFAGTGTSGYTGDGGPATAAEISLDISNVYADILGNIYFPDGNRIRIVRSSMFATYNADSLSVFVNEFCNGPQLTIAISHYTPGYYVNTYFGDGTSATTAIVPGLGGVSGYANLNHNYAASGTYTLKTILMNGTLVLDSMVYTYEYKFCNTIPVKFYYDTNGNCSKDTSEFYLSQAALTEVDSNGVPIDTVSSTSGFYYSALGNPGDVYTFKVLSLPAGLSTVCPASGIVSDTLRSVTYNTTTEFIGLQCNGGNSFDLSENAIVPVTGPNDEWANIYIQNIDCQPMNATVIVYYSKKYFFQQDAHPMPVSFTDSSISWNISGLESDAAAPIDLYYKVNYNPVTGQLTEPDTVHSYYIITPILGDADTVNNSEIIDDTVKNGSDPNEMIVKPSGYVNAGTQLQYSINFENTGNDTAFNIYVVDTLSDNVDAHSLRLIMASNTMNISQYIANGHNLVRFDFPGINLLDSTHHGLCNGAVIFNVNSKIGLTNGTTILNHAGVYFDDNPVVMTDTVENIIGWPASVPNVANQSKVEVYPNPANDLLTIQTGNEQYNSFTIVNSIGEVVIKQSLNTTLTNVNVKTLPSGLYYISLKGDSGVAVRKFVKE